ncbi:zinc finger, CCHC-type containing protein [Tanacetum coccineum]
MDEAIQVSCIIDKLPPSWKDFKHTLKHLKEKLTLVELGSHLRIEESLGMQDSDKQKNNNVAGPYYLCDLNAIPSLGNKKYFVTFIDDASRFCYVSLLHTKDEALDKLKVFKTEVKLHQRSLIKRFKTDRRGEYMDTMYFQSVGVIYEMTAPYTPQQNGISERKNRVLKEMVNSMLSYSGLSQGFWGEAMLTACYLLNRVPNKKNMITPYELWTKRKPNLKYLRVWGCRAVVRLPNLKLKTSSERGIECIFVGYAEHSKAFRFYVIEPNDSVLINSIIESRDAIFDGNRFSLVPRPSLRIPNGTEDIGGLVVPEKVNGEVLADLPPGCKPLGCKWIFKRKLKVDGTIEKFKARLVIQGFKQKLRIDYFDTYAPVACISTIRMMIAMASIHNMIIHQMDVKTAFLNGDLDEEVYMNQTHGFIMPGNENKVIEQLAARSGMDMKMAKTCYHSHWSSPSAFPSPFVYSDYRLWLCGWDRAKSSGYTLAIGNATPTVNEISTCRYSIQ